MAETDTHPTRTAIMDAAEQLMVEHGINGVSIRSILAEAGANTAALHYHFGSRERLIAAILARRGTGMTLRRRAMLEALEGRADPPTVRDVVNALVDPFMEMLQEDWEGSRRFIRFLARLQFDRSTIHREAEDRHFPDIRERLTHLLLETCSHLEPEELERRVIMTLDTMFYTLGNADRIGATGARGDKDQPGNSPDAEQLARYADSLKSFLIGGLQAPSDISRPSPLHEEDSQRG